MTHTPKLVTACPHCGARHAINIRSLKLRPVRRCGRCGRGYSPSQEVASA